MAQITLTESAAPSTPSTGTVAVYAKSDGRVYTKDDAGTEVGLSAVSDGDKGDITVSSSGTAWAIDNNAVTNAKLNDMATQTIKGRTTAGTGDPEDLTATQATAILNAMVGDSGSGGTKGLVPAPASGDAAAGKYLKADGTWATTGGGGVSDGDKGDITVSGSGATWTIDNDVVTYAKMQNVSATSRILGRKTASAGDTEECTLSEVLDFVGSAAQGDILYRGASAWARLGAGTSGYFLKTQGAGANPMWDVASGGSASIPMDSLYGCILSNNGTDATNDIDISVGSRRDSTDAEDMVLASALTKQLDASWAVGTNAGGLDTGSIGNNTYHVWLIKRSDTGVVDVLFSLSATAPTMPANYNYKRRIGSIVRASAAIRAFLHFAPAEFRWKTLISDVAATSTGTSAVTRTLSLPTGIKVRANIVAGIDNAVAAQCIALITDLSETDSAPSSTLRSCAAGLGDTITDYTDVHMSVVTNTSAQIRSRCSTSNASSTLRIATLGWSDYKQLEGE